jgi:imidazolonepropionase-like amidohydrolase
VTRARRTLHALTLLATALLLGVAACRERAPDGVALVGVTLIDGRGGPPQRNMAVVVRGRQIESVVPNDDFKLPRRTLKVDGRGKFVMPGLIDAHAHVARWALPRYLAFGVTTVRDVHGALDSVVTLREQAALGATLAPRIYIAGSMLDGAPATYSDAMVARDNAEARKAVDRLAVAGVDFVKVYTHVGPPMLRAILDEANTFGLRVTGHLGMTDAVTASDLGIRSIEHLSGVPEAALADPRPLLAAHQKSFFGGWTAFERSWATLDSTSLDRVARHLVLRNVILVPTLVLHETLSRLDDPAVMQSSDLAAVPDSERVRWNLPDMIARAGWTPADYAAFRQSRPVQDLFLRTFLRAGGVVAVGTDASNQMIVPGASAHTELELLVHAGLSPADAILAGTHDAAVLLGADSLGTIAPGKTADLLLLSRNPLEDIRNTRSIERVMVRGQLFTPDSLRRGW